MSEASQPRRVPILVILLLAGIVGAGSLLFVLSRSGTDYRGSGSRKVGDETRSEPLSPPKARPVKAKKKRETGQQFIPPRVLRAREREAQRRAEEEGRRDEAQEDGTEEAGPRPETKASRPFR